MVSVIDTDVDCTMDEGTEANSSLGEEAEGDLSLVEGKGDRQGW